MKSMIYRGLSKFICANVIFGFGLILGFQEAEAFSISLINNPQITISPSGDISAPGQPVNFIPNARVNNFGYRVINSDDLDGINETVNVYEDLNIQIFGDAIDLDSQLKLVGNVPEGGSQDFTFSIPLIALQQISQEAGTLKAYKIDLFGNINIFKENQNIQARFVDASKSFEVNTQLVTIPEPITILGAGAALGFGAFFKRKQNHSKSAKKETAKVG